MSRDPLNITARIEKQEKKILQLTKELESAKDEYQKLIEEKEEEDRKALYEAFKKSKRSLDEVLEFMKGKADI